MQTTLLGLAIAVILAIVAALTAPLYIDWNAHRALFETHLSRIAGAPVSIGGAIDATVLPIPRFVFHGVEVGRGDGRLRITEARGSLAVGALLRGEIRAEDIVLDGPRIALELNADGRLVGFAAGAADLLPPLAVEQAMVRNGVVVLHDRRAARTITVEAIDVRGELRSQAGPVKLEGAATIAGVRTQLRLITGRFDGDDGMHLRLVLEPAEGPALQGVICEIDGALSAADGHPQFDGQMVATRAATDAGRPRVRVTGKVLGSADSMRFDKFALSVGPEDRSLDLDGSARLNLGARPRFDAVLGARQLDFDRAAGSEPGASAGPPLGVLTKLLGS